MSGFSLENYVDVPTRLRMAFEKYPELRVQETFREVVEMPDKSCFIRCVVTVWRTADDPIPSIASACEIYPGKTSFSRLHESEVGYTSALGRALGYMGFGINKSIASRDEVEAAQSMQRARLAPVVPLPNAEVPFPDEPQRITASPKQMGLLRALSHGAKLGNKELLEYCANVIGHPIGSVNDLQKHEVSKVIDALKQTSQEQDTEPPF